MVLAFLYAIISTLAVLLGGFAIRIKHKDASTVGALVVAVLFAVQAASTAAGLLVTDSDTFWLAVHVAATCYLFYIVAILAAALDFVAWPLWVKRLLITVVVLLATIEAYVFWTQKIIFSDFHTSSWGNVGDPAPLSVWLAFAFFSYYLLNAVVFTILLRARSRSQSSQFRKTAFRTALVLTLSVVFFSLYTFVCWWQLGWPQVSSLFDMTGTGTAFLFLVQYRHLLFDTALQEHDLTRAVGSPVLLVNADFRIAGANEAASKLFGLTEAAMIGTEAQRLFDEPGTLVADWQNTHKQTDHIACSVRKKSFFATLSVTRDKEGDTIGGSILVRPLDQLDLSAEAYSLTVREKDIVLMLLRGSSSKEIATLLFIAEGTVKVHIHNIFDKTGVRSRVDLFNLFLGRATG